MAKGKQDPNYKTEICRFFAEGQECRFGAKCLYAHGQDELRTRERPAGWKTRPCWHYHKTGTCPYGQRCHFVHQEQPHPKSPAAEKAPPPAALWQEKQGLLEPWQAEDVGAWLLAPRDHRRESLLLGSQ